MKKIPRDKATLTEFGAHVKPELTVDQGEKFMVETNDNWWNLHLGHGDAYAATNFPLGVVTLYPAFFTVPVDNTERAVILFHEAQHLMGAGEDAALERVWREKQRIGWTSEAYARTKVWSNTREWTVASLPALFECGPNRRADCAP